MLIYSESAEQDFLQLNIKGVTKCDEILVSMPYAMQGAASDEFYKNILESKVKTKTFFRIDWSLPFDTRIIKQYRTSENIFRGIEEILHAKLIWWVGWGAYVGSCNLTDRACFQNFEAGVFLSHKEIIERNMQSQLASFFYILEESSILADDDLIGFLDLQDKKLESFRKIRFDISKKFTQDMRERF